MAFIAGFVNSTGFLLIGSFTSHVTGNVGRIANDVASGDLRAATAATIMVLAFFGGAFMASMILESGFYRQPIHAWCTALVAEAMMLLGFMVLSRFMTVDHPRIRDAEALLLCCAMGIQNGLATRSSGSGVRTTHLTGVVTDLGLEAARWFRYGRGSLAEMVHVPLAVGPNPAIRPSFETIAVSATVAVCFVLGAIAAAVSVVHLRHLAVLIPSVLLIACAGVSIWVHRRVASERASGEDPFVS